MLQWNDTLDDHQCPNAGTSDTQTGIWLDVFAPEIADRLNKYAPGAHLKHRDIANLMSLCPFETVAYERNSPWCGLFTEEEWASYEYYGDLDDYYGNGCADSDLPLCSLVDLVLVRTDMVSDWDQCKASVM